MPKNSSRSPEESNNPEINADSGNWTSSELPEMNKMVQLQFPRRLRLLNCFNVGRLHCYTASAKKWNEQRCTTDNWMNASANICKWNWMKCKCKHFQMKQLDNHSKLKCIKWQTVARHVKPLLHTPRLFKLDSVPSLQTLSAKICTNDCTSLHKLVHHRGWLCLENQMNLELPKELFSCFLFTP